MSKSAWISATAAAVIVVTVGCTTESDPAVGGWYGKVEDPEGQARQLVDSLEAPDGEAPTLAAATGMLAESRYVLKLHADATGHFDGTACRWYRDDETIVLEIGAAGDPEIIRLTPDGRYLRGHGYVFAPWER